MFLISSVKRRLVRWIRSQLRAGSGSERFEVELSDGTKVEVYGDKVEVEEEAGAEEDGEVNSSWRDRLTGRDSVSRGDGGESMRESSYSGDSESKIASRATKNKMIFNDVMSDPSLVGADSEVEAVARIGVENPGWASFVDFEADLGVDPAELDAASGDADAAAGESRHGSSGEGSPDYSGDHGVGVDGVNPGEGSGPDAGVETGASIDTGSGSVDVGGNSVGGSGSSGGSGGSSGSGGDGGVGGGNSV
jgi:hypothetical protein